MARLTKNEIESIIALVNERLAGGSGDIADALGCSEDKAEKICEFATSALSKLSERL